MCRHFVVGEDNLCYRVMKYSPGASKMKCHKTPRLIFFSWNPLAFLKLSSVNFNDGQKKDYR